MIILDSIPIPEAKTWQQRDRSQRSICMQSDEQLAQSAQRGSHQSLQDLIERHHTPLFGFLYRLSGSDRMLAEDLVQEAFLHAFRGLSSYRYPRPFKPWLYAIALNCYRDRCKRSEFRQTVETIDNPQVGFEPTDPGPSPEEQQEKQTDLEELFVALQQLSLPLRETLLLRYSQGLPLAEISEILEIPLGTVKSRISIGLQRLRINLEERR
jgi:RNA polymerase sigma-70 factor (ECF subfamily)